ncbi:hypothetical protein BDY24DRAFT_444398 [Mrakia frigida]|uniref:uncharacterized protein n=1 Tax=Mrakia frigida TaxID=29902 RepID=UPI003FCC004C
MVLEVLMLPREVVTGLMHDDEYDQEFGELSVEDLSAVRRAEEEQRKKKKEGGSAAGGAMEGVVPLAEHVESRPSPELESLQGSSRLSQAPHFFTPYATQNWEDNEGGSDSECEAEGPSRVAKGKRKAFKKTAWFSRPGTMSESTYDYFSNEITHLLGQKEGVRTKKPPSFDAGSFWIHPPDPVFTLLSRNINLPLLYRPRVYLHLPHLLVHLRCPRCKGSLEINDKSPPRRVVDVEDNFYIVTPRYYCRKTCKETWSGWDPQILRTLPASLQLAFPAMLSQRSGLSLAVVKRWDPPEFVPSSSKVTPVDSTGSKTRFGNFSDLNGYGGFVPSKDYLVVMLNRSLVKRIAKVDEVPIFTALFTAMGGWYIRSQILTLTKSWDERIGPLLSVASSLRSRGHEEPSVVYSDDPTKDKGLLLQVFPSLGTNLAPMATVYGLQELKLPSSTKIVVLNNKEVVQSVFASIMSPLEDLEDPTELICASIDAEEDLHHPDILTRTSPSLPRQLPPPRAGLQDRFQRQGDLPSDLGSQPFTIIDLKDFARRQGLLPSNESGSLDALASKVLGKFLPKDSSVRTTDDWERKVLSDEQKTYAALDVHASRCIFEKARESPTILPFHSSPQAGTSVAILLQIGGVVTAYGSVADEQPDRLGDVQVRTGGQDRIIVDVKEVLVPAAGAVLHVSSNGKEGKSCRSLAQLQRSSLTKESFKVVVPQHLLAHDRRTMDFGDATVLDPRLVGGVESSASAMPSVASSSQTIDRAEREVTPEDVEEGWEDEEEGGTRLEEGADEFDDEAMASQDVMMLEASHDASLVRNGKKRAFSDPDPPLLPPPPITDELFPLLINPIDASAQTSKIKKDIFHLHDMIKTPVNHSALGPYSRACRDATFRWNPDDKAKVERVLHHSFGIFEEQLRRRPGWILRRCRRTVNPPSVLLKTLSLVYSTFGPMLDALTQKPLFNAAAFKKTESIFTLCREGYVTDAVGVQCYEKKKVDSFGLQTYFCLRGTNKVEGGPHADVFRKFSPMNAGPKLTVNCLSDHRTQYNFQAFAKHEHGVDWDFHHNISLINRTSVLLNYLADAVPGAESYRGWMNGDLYERTSETFGICPTPDALRDNWHTAPLPPVPSERKKQTASQDWLRQKQGVALAILPPTTLFAMRYFHKTQPSFVVTGRGGKTSVNWVGFAQGWNETADGVERTYITPDMLMAYSKRFEKASNTRATLAKAPDDIRRIEEMRTALNNPEIPFPSSSSIPSSVQPTPSNGADSLADLPSSLSLDVPISRPIPPLQTSTQATDLASGSSSSTSGTSKVKRSRRVGTQAAVSSGGGAGPLSTTPAEASVASSSSSSRITASDRDSTSSSRRRQASASSTANIDVGPSETPPER